MATAHDKNDLYEVILIESDDDFAVICPGIPGAVSQGADKEEALKMIADTMAMCRMYPLPGEENPAPPRDWQRARRFNPEPTPVPQTAPEPAAVSPPAQLCPPGTPLPRKP